MPMKRVTTESGRYYYDSQGQRYWSVTTLLNQGVPKPALIPWAAAEASKSIIHHLAKPLEATRGLLEDALHSIMVRLTSIDDDHPDWEVVCERLQKSIDAYNDRDTPLGMIASGVKTHVEKGRKVFSTAHTRVRDTAAEAGTEAHAAIEQYILGEKLPEVTGATAEIVEQFQQFERDWNPTWEAAELTVFNPEAGYAGTLDWVADIPALGEGLTLGDIKTGKGVYPETALQLAAYRHATFAESSRGQVSVDMPKTERAVVLHIRPTVDGKPAYYELIPMQTDEETFNTFRYVTLVAYHSREGKKLMGDKLQVPESNDDDRQGGLEEVSR